MSPRSHLEAWTWPVGIAQYASCLDSRLILHKPESQPEILDCCLCRTSMSHALPCLHRVLEIYWIFGKSKLASHATEVTNLLYLHRCIRVLSWGPCGKAADTDSPPQQAVLTQIPTRRVLKIFLSQSQ